MQMQKRPGLDTKKTLIMSPKKIKGTNGRTRSPKLSKINDGGPTPPPDVQA